MNKVYIVLYNGNVSSEGYDSEQKAVEFIESRSGYLERIFNWEWEDEDLNSYMIKEINIK